jgi:hypothetical protein
VDCELLFFADGILPGLFGDRKNGGGESQSQETRTSPQTMDSLSSWPSDSSKVAGAIWVKDN